MNPIRYIGLAGALIIGCYQIKISNRQTKMGIRQLECNVILTSINMGNNNMKELWKAVNFLDKELVKFGQDPMNQILLFNKQRELKKQIKDIDNILKNYVDNYNELLKLRHGNIPCMDLYSRTLHNVSCLMLH